MNNEKKDKVIEMLKEINHILHETNLEMAQALNCGKDIVEKYVLFDRVGGAYITNNFECLTLGRLQDAKIYYSRIEAFDAREQILIDNEDLDIDIVIKQIKIKVVE